jgi:hypothetical protein
VTLRPAVASSEKKANLHLGVVQAGRASLERHPRDGWKLAEPYPLGEGSRRALRAIIEALCPPSPAPRSADLTRRVELGARCLLRYMHPVVSRGLALGLLLLDWLPILTLASKFRMHRLDSGKARALFTRWAKSPFAALRLLVMGARSLVLSVYFDQSEVHAALNYDPVGFQKSRMRLRAHLVMPRKLAAE